MFNNLRGTQLNVSGKEIYTCSKIRLTENVFPPTPILTLILFKAQYCFWTNEMTSFFE